jgi:hypothetical protein
MTKLSTSFLLDSEKVTRFTEQGPGTEPLQHEAPREEFWQLLGAVAPSSTGILPPGVMSIRRGGGFTQLVIETEPGVYLTCWGASEYGGHAVYQLAMPWRYIIGVYKGPDLIGARLFYSPRRITHERQVLYHSNVPNINCKSYGTDNGVGWICLYHQGYKATDIADMARYLTDRASGAEPYNDANMSGTDGPRFYHGMLQAAKIEGREFLYDPHAWEAKTTDEGFEWALEPDLWVPVLVKSNDIQTMHEPEGIPLTLGMAMSYPSKFYYDDPHQPKLYDAADHHLDWEKTPAAGTTGVRLRSGNFVSPLQQLWDALQAGFTAVAAKKAKPAKRDLTPLEQPPEVFKGLKWMPSSFRPTHTVAKGSTDEKFYCEDCGAEASIVDEDEQWWCKKHYPYKPCKQCGDQYWFEDLVKMTKTSHLKLLDGITRSSLLCPDCFRSLTAEAEMKIAEAEEMERDEEPGLVEEPARKTPRKAPSKSKAKAVATAAK